MNGRKPTADERLWLDLVTEIGCIICRKNGIESAAEIHHVDGSTKPGAHYHVIPLCARHHRIPGDGYATRHGSGKRAGKKAFEAEHGSEFDLLLDVARIINERASCIIERVRNSAANYPMVR